jgi:hypothetical protein
MRSHTISGRSWIYTHRSSIARPGAAPLGRQPMGSPRAAASASATQARSVGMIEDPRRLAGRETTQGRGLDRHPARGDPRERRNPFRRWPEESFYGWSSRSHTPTNRRILDVRAVGRDGGADLARGPRPALDARFGAHRRRWDQRTPGADCPRGAAVRRQRPARGVHDADTHRGAAGADAAGTVSSVARSAAGRGDRGRGIAALPAMRPTSVCAR